MPLPEIESKNRLSSEPFKVNLDVLPSRPSRRGRRFRVSRRLLKVAFP